jgi:hypothetical protein
MMPTERAENERYIERLQGQFQAAVDDLTDRATDAREAIQRSLPRLGDGFMLQDHRSPQKHALLGAAMPPPIPVWAAPQPPRPSLFHLGVGDYAVIGCMGVGFILADLFIVVWLVARMGVH